MGESWYDMVDLFRFDMFDLTLQGLNVNEASDCSVVVFFSWENRFMLESFSGCKLIIVKCGLMDILDRAGF